MASSPLRAPAAAAAGQQQSRLYEMQKKFQERHLTTLAAVKGAAASTTSPTATTDVVGREPPTVPARRFGGAGVIVPQQRRRTPGAGSGRSGSVGSADGSASSAAIVQVDVKGKVRQLFAERHQQQHVQGLGFAHHQQQRRQRRRSLTGRDRSRPLRPLSGADNDPLCKTVCFTAPSIGGDVRGEMLALFGRLPNLGGSLWSESFRAGNGIKMKTAQSAPELKWLLDAGGGGPGGRVLEKPHAFVTTVAEPAMDDREGDDDWRPQQQQQSRPIGRLNSKTTTVAKKPQQATAAAAAVNGNGHAVKKPAFVAVHDGVNDTVAVTPNRLLLPPVVQPTVINALAAGAGAAAAVASVGAAAAAGPQKPAVRAPRLPGSGTPRPSQQQLPKPVAPSRQRSTVAARQPVAQHRGPPSGSQPRTAVKPQLSADRGPPAKGMARCPLCARDFASDRLPKHEEVCRRTRDKDRKRKVFDTSRKRLDAVAAEAGVDVASLKKKGQKEEQRAAEKLQRKKDAWRRKHEQLVRNVRAARAVQRHLAAGGNIRDLPPELDNAGAAEQGDDVDSDLVKCPHCNRTFNEASAERHVPLCAERQRNAAARMQNNKRR